MKHESESEARNTLIEALDKLTGSKWMVAAWKIDPVTGAVHIHRTSWQWPTNDNMLAVLMLMDLLVKEAQNATPEPLPMADVSAKLAEIRRATLLKLKKENEDAEVAVEDGVEVADEEAAGCGCCCIGLAEEVAGPAGGDEGAGDLDEQDSGGPRISDL